MTALSSDFDLGWIRIYGIVQGEFFAGFSGGSNSEQRYVNEFIRNILRRYNS